MSDFTTQCLLAAMKEQDIKISEHKYTILVLADLRRKDRAQIESLLAEKQSQESQMKGLVTLCDSLTALLGERDQSIDRLTDDLDAKTRNIKLLDDMTSSLESLLDEKERHINRLALGLDNEIMWRRHWKRLYEDHDVRIKDFEKRCFRYDDQTFCRTCDNMLTCSALSPEDKQLFSRLKQAL